MESLAEVFSIDGMLNLSYQVPIPLVPEPKCSFPMTLVLDILGYQTVLLEHWTPIDGSGRCPLKKMDLMVVCQSNAYLIKGMIRSAVALRHLMTLTSDGLAHCRCH